MKSTSLLVAACLALAPTLHAQTAQTPTQIAQQTVGRYVILLGLSSSQQEEILTILTTEATSEATIRTTERTDRAALVKAIEANNNATLTELSAALGDLNGQSTFAHAHAEAQIYALLTSEQQTKFAQILSAGPGGPGGGHGGPGGPPQQ